VACFSKRARHCATNAGPAAGNKNPLHDWPFVIVFDNTPDSDAMVSARAAFALSACPFYFKHKM
jgi:hypothetical protein